MPKRTCTVEGCEKPTQPHRPLCSMHRARLYRNGTHDLLEIGACLTCGAEVRRQQRHGMPSYCSRACYDRGTTRPLRDACLGCGGPMPTDRRRKYCTPACRHLHYHHGGSKRPTSIECATCGEQVDITERMADGSLRRPAYTRRCDLCMANARPHRYSLNAAQVADRDGTECKWCGDVVDLSLIGSRSMWAPSVDHIIPWARGGTDDPDNLQLMHRVCNAQKGTRIA